MKWQNTCKAHSTYLADSTNISHHDDSPSESPVHPIPLNLNLRDTLSSYHSLSQIPLMVYKMGYEIKSKLGIQALCLQPTLQRYPAFLPFASNARAHPTLSRTLYVSCCYTFAYAMLTLFPAPQNLRAPLFSTHDKSYPFLEIWLKPPFKAFCVHLSGGNGSLHFRQPRVQIPLSCIQTALENFKSFNAH